MYSIIDNRIIDSSRAVTPFPLPRSLWSYYVSALRKAFEVSETISITSHKSDASIYQDNVCLF